jgi:hypothetical protein
VPDVIFIKTGGTIKGFNISSLSNALILIEETVE